MDNKSKEDEIMCEFSQVLDEYLLTMFWWNILWAYTYVFLAVAFAVFATSLLTVWDFLVNILQFGDKQHHADSLYKRTCTYLFNNSV